MHILLVSEGFSKTVHENWLHCLPGLPHLLVLLSRWAVSTQSSPPSRLTAAVNSDVQYSLNTVLFPQLPWKHTHTHTPALNQMWDKAKCWQGCRTAETINTLLVEVKGSVAALEEGLARSPQTKIHLPYDTAILTLGVSEINECVCPKKTCTRISRAGLQ